MMKHIKLLLVSLSLLNMTVTPQAAEITVFAAASLTDTLKELGTAYEKRFGDKVVFSFAGSGPLARQIEEGAPADIYFSADEAKADGLQKKGLLLNETRVTGLGNLLVIVTTPDCTNVQSPSDLTNTTVKRIALGDVRTVPAGTYAKVYFDKLGLWPAVEPKIVSCESVRAVLAAVESGNIEVGIVYKTDATISKHVKTAYVVPPADGPKVTYPMALVKNSREPLAAKKFLDYLVGAEASAVFARYGFILLPTQEYRRKSVPENRITNDQENTNETQRP
jgi:molybdate transport system substrate-binding protein